MTKEIHVLTGGTSGMGLHVAEVLARRQETHVVVGARKPDQARELRRAIPLDRLTVLPLDLDSLVSVRSFADAVGQFAAEDSLSSIICNAGLQLTGEKVMAAPNVERTFMVNVLAHVLLVDLLMPDLRPGAHVVTIGSGTHNPNDKLAKMFGFRGAVFPNAQHVISGDLGTEGKPQQLNMDRYATSKLGAIYLAMLLAREVAPDICSFFSFDPGLMPGTALARDRSAIEQFGWKFVMPPLRHFMSGVSSSKASANALVEHCILNPKHPSGSYIEFTGNLAPRSNLSENNSNAHDLLQVSRMLLQSGN